MNYRNIGKILLVTAALVSCVAANERPNVLFLAVDDMNDMIGPMGCRQLHTPNLDRLAARGTVFMNAQTPSPWCAPSRSAIMTGLQPFHSGLYADEPAQFNLPDHVDLVRNFKKNGYETAGGGKIYHHMPGQIDLRGFDQWFIWNPESKLKGWGLKSWDEGAPVPPEVPFCDTAKYTGWKEFDFYAMPNADEEKMADTICANWAAEFLKKKHDKPFFLAFGRFAPHKPNYVPQKYFDLYPLDKIQLPEVLANDIDDVPASVRKVVEGRAKKVHNQIVAHGDWPRAIQGYLAAISYTDAMMGRVLDALEKSPYASNTVVVFWSDNGYHLGEKTWWAKHTLWQRSTNVPFIWAGPGVPKGVKTDCTVSLIDTYKTLIDLCGLPAQDKLDGESLMSVFKNPAEAKDRTVIVTYDDSYALVNRQWRYIARPDGEELYDVKADWHEWKNLAGNPEYTAVKKELAAQVPVNPAPAGLGQQSKTLRLICEGENFRWAPVKNPGLQGAGGKTEKKGKASED